MAIGAALLFGCSTVDHPPTTALRLGAAEFQAQRPSLAGELATVSGFLVSAGFTGDNLCLKVLVDDDLRTGPDLMIARRGLPRAPASVDASEGAEPEPFKPSPVRTREAPAATDWLARVVPRVWGTSLVDAWMLASRPEPRADTRSARVGAVAESKFAPASETDLRAELELAEAYAAARDTDHRVQRAVVVHACKRPPTRANKKAAKHALEWLQPLKKPERITRAPTLASLRRELQLFYLERSRAYDWTDLEWTEVTLTGTLLGRGAVFEDEVMGGVDMVPYVVGVHDPHRRSWLFIDLTFDDSVAKEVVFKLFGDQAGLLRKAGGAALKGGLP
jgi:hypothetical protein